METKPINFEERIKSMEDLRREMGTHPDTNVEKRTEFHRGVTEIKVQLLSATDHPYRQIFDLATATWGKRIDKWPNVSPSARLSVVKAVLDFQSLPNAMEAVKFGFAVEGCSRSAFDQIARARIGVIIGSMGWRDNDHSDAAYRIPESIWKNETLRERVQEMVLQEKELYHDMVSSGQANWQNARGHMGIFFEHRFAIAFDYMALRNFMAKRLKFCEQEDTVATAWLMRKEVLEKFPLLGAYLLPGCDFKRKCDYHQADGSEAFGCLFRGCGRWPDPYSYASWNESCSDEDTIADQANVYIPEPAEGQAYINVFKDLESVPEPDYSRFHGEG